MRRQQAARIQEPNVELSDLMPPVFRVQLVREAGVKRTGISDAHDAMALLRRYLEHEDREHFVTLMLDVKNQVIGIHTVSIGNLNSAIVSPREVFKAAILANAASIILGHNHPSGDPTPSQADIAMTREVIDAAKVLRLSVHDHVIVGRDGLTSFRAQGLI